jgi:methyltransferase (TIGR00027 family)
MDAVARTSLLVAAVRAEETKRADRLFEDPFAETLAGEAGYDARRQWLNANERSVPIIEVRTRFFDERFAEYLGRGIRQIVILAAGMDTRAYRLPFLSGTRLFELDRPSVLDYKNDRLSHVRPECERVVIPADLTTDWSDALRSEGFNLHASTLWLAEGLTQYLEASEVTALIARIDALSAPSSVLLFDVIGRSLLESPMMRATLEAMVKMGAPWRFGTENPELLVAPLGWTAAATQPSEVGARLGRWPFPAAPRGTPGIPTGYLVEAVKR